MSVVSTVESQPNTRRGSKHPSFFRRTPYSVADWHDAALLQRARDYMRPIKRLRRGRTVASLTLSLVLVLALVGPRVAGVIPGAPWPLRLVAILLVTTVIETVAMLPFGYWFDMVHEKRWGFSSQEKGLWVRDQFKGFGLTVTIGAVLLCVLYWLIRATALWWLYAGLAIGLVAITGIFIYPVLILPLFNRQAPAEGELKDRVDRVAALAGMAVDKAFVMDASKRSSRDNAFVAGAGKTKRVVMFDTILEHPGHVLDNVVAHELGHYRLRHFAYQLPFIMAISIIQFGVVAAIATWPPVLRLAGVTSLGDPASLPLLSLLLLVVAPPEQMAAAWFSRVLERQADLEALELLGDPGAFIDLWHRFASKNLGDLEPSWYSRAQGSHPVGPERMAFGKAWAELNGVPIVEPTDTRPLAPPKVAGVEAPEAGRFPAPEKG